jgi:hypothetical protein
MQDQSRDDDREAGVMTEQMRTDADQMHQEAEMAHDRDMLHFKGVLDLARQVEANKMKAIPNVKGK